MQMLLPIVDIGCREYLAWDLGWTSARDVAEPTALNFKTSQLFWVFIYPATCNTNTQPRVYNVYMGVPKYLTYLEQPNDYR